MATLIWLIYKNATSANLLLQICSIITMIPTWKSVWRDSKNEKPLPWFLWAITNLIMVLVVLFRWNGQYQDLAAPSLAAITQIATAILALKK